MGKSNQKKYGADTFGVVKSRALAARSVSVEPSESLGPSAQSKAHRARFRSIGSHPATRPDVINEITTPLNRNRPRPGPSNRGPRQGGGDPSLGYARRRLREAPAAWLCVWPSPSDADAVGHASHCIGMGKGSTPPPLLGVWPGRRDGWGLLSIDLDRSWLIGADRAPSSPSTHTHRTQATDPSVHPPIPSSDT